jgi:dUTP pyrophosphatase
MKVSGENSVEMRIVRLPHARDLPVPQYQSALAAGLDLIAAVPADAPVEIPPGGRALIPNGIAIALPAGHEGQIRPRSGFAARRGITVLNSPGTVDADYRGEVQVILINLGAEAFVVRRGMRVAQLVIAPVTQVEIVEVAALPPTERAAGGLGSTGLEANAGNERG